MKPLLRNAWLPVVLAGTFIFLDLLTDRLTSPDHGIDLPHIVLVGLVLLITFTLVRQATQTHRRAEAALRQARDELEVRVRERTAELSRANEALQAEISERDQAQEQIKHLSSFPRLNPNPVLEIDASGTITYRNMAATTALERLGLEDDARAIIPDDIGTILHALHQKKESAFQREVRIGGAVFSETVQVIPEFNAVRIYALDITERKLSEEVLQSTRIQVEAEKRHLEAVLQALPVGVIITDAQGGILLTSGMDEQIWGSRPTTHNVDDYVQYKAWWADSGKPVEPHEWASAQAVLEGKPVIGQVLEIQRFDGGRSFVLNSAVPIRDEIGRVIGSAVAIQDITELRRAEQALRASEEKYRLLFQNMTEGFALYELLYNEQGEPADWRILEVNDAYTRHTGLAREQIAGRRISELFPPSIPEYLPRFAQVVDTQTPSDFETYAKAVGRYQRVVTFPAGGHRFASTIEDITERKHAEEALRASEVKFATVFQSSPDAIGIFRAADGTLLDVNEAFTVMLGYARSEVVGRSWAELSPLMTGSEDIEVTEQLRERGQAADYEISLTTRQGAVATLLLSLVQMTVGEQPCFLAIAHDITKRRRFEEALRQTQVELARVDQERARMEERQRLARELHDSVSQAFYGISLGAHTALTHMDTDRDRVFEALHYVISLARAGLTEMRGLIFDLRPESLEMEGLVAALSKHTAAVRASHGVEITLSVSDEPVVSLPIKEALYRIAQEAIQNAVKHARFNRLEVRLINEPDCIRLEVCDDGKGFDPLAAYPGHLGLHSMRERATSVGGTLDIASSPDRGTQVRAHIPISVAETEERAESG
jgi:PAS domain S-box-containing protein